MPCRVHFNYLESACNFHLDIRLCKYIIQIHIIGIVYYMNESINRDMKNSLCLIQQNP